MYFFCHIYIPLYFLITGNVLANVIQMTYGGNKLNFIYVSVPASCSSGNAFVSGPGGWRFKSRAGQIGQCCQQLASVATFFELCCLGAIDFSDHPSRKLTPPTRYTLRRIATSVLQKQMYDSLFSGTGSNLIQGKISYDVMFFIFVEQYQF